MASSGTPPVEASVIIPAWRLPDALDRCLTALGRQAGAPVFETIVVVNGAAPAVVDVARRHPLSPVVVPLAGNIGFGGACNVGAARARGAHVVFLNDDAEPEPGWLAALVATARERRAQLVASVLLDGEDRVAEAGARVLSNSETQPLGEGTLADAEASGALRTRPVDYGSGAGLLVAADLFASLGGFDPAYAPAYYEDVDLQWRAREKGVDVWLAGDARIRHVSGQSTQDHQGFRTFASLRARRVFVDRWRDVLATAPRRESPASGPTAIPRRDRAAPPRPPVLDDPATVQAAADAVQAAFAAWSVEQTPARRAASGTVVLEHLAARLRAVAPHVAPVTAPDAALDVREDDVAVRASILLTALVEATRSGADEDVTARRWLLAVAVLGRFPTDDELTEVGQALRHGTHQDATMLLLCIALGSPDAAAATALQVVTDRVVVEVDYSARDDNHTGIQRVVRETVPRWAVRHDVVLARWADSGRSLLTLTAQESDRVLRYTTRDADPRPGHPSDRVALVVPFGTQVLFPDVPAAAHSDVVRPLATAARNRLGHVGYDLIPLTSAELRAASEPLNTARLFSVLKHSDRVAGISASATAEFAGLVATLPAQGLPGPTVAEVTLPAVGAPLPPGPDAARTTDRPVVLIVGTRERHKNQRAVLHAAELLWREGLDFEVRQVGGPGSDDVVFREAADALTAAGWPLTVLGRVSEQRLWDEQRAADVAVFVSVHEGYGLPVAEALCVGTPVVTTRYGAQAQVAADGGCLLVDPRDDDDIAHALRRLITEPGLREDLAAQAARRPRRAWDEYAVDLWQFLTAGAR